MNPELPKIDKEFVRHIGRLARLSLSEEELFSFQEEFQKILEFISEIFKAKYGGELFFFNTQELSDLREDTPKEGTERELLVEQFLHKEDGYLRIKRILKKGES